MSAIDGTDVLGRRSFSVSQNEDHGSKVAAEHGIARSSHWPHVREQILASQLAAWRARIRGFDEKYKGVEWEVHHKIAFHFGALLNLGYIELDPLNLVVAPRHPVDLHLLLGHLDDFKSFNVGVAADLKKWGGELWGGQGTFLKAKIHDEIRLDRGWIKKHLARPRSWAEMSGHDKAALADLIRKTLPIVHTEAA